MAKGTHSTDPKKKDEASSALTAPEWLTGEVLVGLGLYKAFGEKLIEKAIEAATFKLGGDALKHDTLGEVVSHLRNNAQLMITEGLDNVQQHVLRPIQDTVGAGLGHLPAQVTAALNDARPHAEKMLGNISAGLTSVAQQVDTGLSHLGGDNPTVEFVGKVAVKAAKAVPFVALAGMDGKRYADRVGGYGDYCAAALADEMGKHPEHIGKLDVYRSGNPIIAEQLNRENLRLAADVATKLPLLIMLLEGRETKDIAQHVGDASFAQAVAGTNQPSMVETAMNNPNVKALALTFAATKANDLLFGEALNAETVAQKIATLQDSFDTHAKCNEGIGKVEATGIQEILIAAAKLQNKELHITGERVKAVTEVAHHIADRINDGELQVRDLVALAGRYNLVALDGKVAPVEPVEDGKMLSARERVDLYLAHKAVLRDQPVPEGNLYANAELAVIQRDFAQATGDAHAFDNIKAITSSGVEKKSLMEKVVPGVALAGVAAYAHHKLTAARDGAEVESVAAPAVASSVEQAMPSEAILVRTVPASSSGMQDHEIYTEAQTSARREGYQVPVPVEAGMEGQKYQRNELTRAGAPSGMSMSQN